MDSTRDHEYMACTLRCSNDRLFIFHLVSQSGQRLRKRCLAGAWEVAGLQKINGSVGTVSKLVHRRICTRLMSRLCKVLQRAEKTQCCNIDPAAWDLNLCT